MTADSTKQVADGIQAVTINGSGNKPRLVVCGAPAEGHTAPMIRVARELKQRGYPISFVTGEEFREPVEELGAELFAVGPMFTPEVLAARSQIPPGFAQLIYDMKEGFIAHIAPRWVILKKTLETLRERNPTETIVILSEPFFMGVNPLIYGAPLPKGFTERPKVVKLGINPYVAYSIDVGPGGPGLPPDSTESGRARNALLNMLFEMGPFAEPTALETEVMKELGAVDFKPDSLITKWYHAPDLTLQMTPPSVEYPRSDLPANVKFIGCLEAKPMKPGFVYPSWWDEVTKSGKKVVMVTQGTVQTAYTDLIIPTIKALADKEDVFVVAVLGVKGNTLPEDFQVPANTRVIDYLNYDALLPHADVFVGNAGYGGFLHGLINAVPMVLAGVSEDKPEVAARGEWAGVAVNLRTGQPSEEQVRQAVEKILGDDSYKRKVEAVKKENENLPTLDLIEKYIHEVMA